MYVREGQNVCVCSHTTHPIWQSIHERMGITAFFSEAPAACSFSLWPARGSRDTVLSGQWKEAAVSSTQGRTNRHGADRH